MDLKQLRLNDDGEPWTILDDVFLFLSRQYEDHLDSCRVGCTRRNGVTCHVGRSLAELYGLAETL